MSMQKQKLLEAEAMAARLFKAVEERGLITPGKSEKELNTEVFHLAEELLGIKKYWHPRLIRSGPNTLLPYHENPPDLILQEDDILFFDFGPIVEEWEADFGRTYVIGQDPVKQKLKDDIEKAWAEGKEWFHQQTSLTGAQYYQYITDMATRYGWEYGGEIAGHLIGHFPHERLEKGNYGLYVHPGNDNDMFLPDSNGQPRDWILEIHFIHRAKKIGGFFEQLLK
jgi:Xaa-Pro aminopeptidase